MCKWGNNVEVEVIKEHVSLGHKIHIDECMAKTIEELNKLGLKTTGCCCGHGKGMRYIGFQLKPGDGLLIGHDGHVQLEFLDNEQPIKKEEKMEIEIRAWDKKNNRMHYYVGISPCAVQIYEDDQKPPEITIDRDRDLFDLMLWTGRKDKKNIKIYLTDFCKCTHPNYTHFVEGEIVFDSERSIYSLKTMSDGEIPLYEFDEIEVLGNRLENAKFDFPKPN